MAMTTSNSISVKAEQAEPAAVIKFLGRLSKSANQIPEHVPEHRFLQ